MDFIEPILSIATSIYALSEQVKANKQRCSRVAQRVKGLEELVVAIQRRGPGQTSAMVEQTLAELKITLESSEKLIKKYTSCNFLERMAKAFSHGDDFSSVNERLNDAFQVLSLGLQVDQGNKLHKVFEITSREKEDKMDGREDDKALKKLLLKSVEVQENMAVTAVATDTHDLKENMKTILEIINKPSIISHAIREIKPEELTYELPKKPFMKTSTSEVYKGEYNKFTVAIKRYIDPMSTCPREVRNVFWKEVETMRRFESPNILRMFGICVQDENGHNPNFLIIMEYCVKGSLREVLDSRSKLPWYRKARMCLDAAQGVYRLHQTEEKAKVHGCINSSKFLVAEGYRVKLGGLELAKTETSLKKKPKKGISSLCYSSPQQLGSIHHLYNKECEMYSFGIVMWEIATRQKPYDGCSGEDIYQRVFKDKYQEPLPDDCPGALGQLINACRAYDSFYRPSAGVLVDELRKVVEQLEEE